MPSKCCAITRLYVYYACNHFPVYAVYDDVFETASFFLIPHNPGANKGQCNTSTFSHFTQAYCIMCPDKRSNENAFHRRSACAIASGEKTRRGPFFSHSPRWPSGLNKGHIFPDQVRRGKRSRQKLLNEMTRHSGERRCSHPAIFAPSTLSAIPTHRRN